MATMTIADAESALRQLVGAQIIPQYEEEVNVSKLIRKADNPSYINGKGYKIAIKFDPPKGGRRGGETMTAATPVPWRLAEMYTHRVKYMFPARISGDTIRDFKDEASLVDGLSGLMAHYTSAAAKDKEIGVFGDGSSLRATVLSVAGSVITCASAGAATFGSTKGAVHLLQGESYDVISTAGVNRGTCTITALTATTATVDAVPGGTVAGDILVPSNSYNTSETGLAKLISNANDTVQFINRTNEPKAKSPVLDLNTNSLTVSAISAAKALLRNRNGVKSAKTTTAFLPASQEEYLRRIGHNLREFTSGERTLDVSFDSFAHGTTVFTPAIDCCENRVYFVDLDDFRWYEQYPMGTYDLDGNIMRMVMGASGNGSDVYALAIGWGGNYGVGSFKNHLLINRADFASLSTQVASYQ